MVSREKAQSIVVSILAVLALVTSYSAWASDTHEKLLVAFLDVGQGDAIYIRSPYGKDMLIDAGPPTGAVLSALAAVMPAHDRHIDVIMATHPDADHIGGFPDILDRFSISTIATTENEAETGIFLAFRDAAENEPEATFVYVHRGSVVDLGGGATFTILFPDRDASGWDANTSSIVGVLRYGSTTVFLSGDSPQSVERYLARQDGVSLDVDIVKLGHHGSPTSSADELFAVTSPAYAIVSAGRGNQYGHPGEDVTDRVFDEGACLLRTDESGTIVFYSDGFTWEEDVPCSEVRGPIDDK